jgi:hypothetical protein
VRLKDLPPCGSFCSGPIEGLFLRKLSEVRSSVSDLYFGRNLCDYSLYLCKEGLMILMRVQCPYGQSAQISKGGKPETGQ